MKKYSFLIILAVFAVCSSISGQTTIIVKVTQPEQLSVNAGSDKTIIQGESSLIGDHSIVLGGTPDYSYSWTPIEGLNDPSTLNPLANPSDTTTYYLTVTDAQGCTISDSLLLIVAVATNIDLLKDAELKVYPNPSPTGIFTLSYYGGEKPMSVSATSFDGKVVLQKSIIYPSSKTMLDLSESPGINIIRFEIDDYSFSKIIVNSSSR